MPCAIFPIHSKYLFTRNMPPNATVTKIKMSVSSPLPRLIEATESAAVRLLVRSMSVLMSPIFLSRPIAAAWKASGCLIACMT